MEHFAEPVRAEPHTLNERLDQPHHAAGIGDGERPGLMVCLGGGYVAGGLSLPGDTVMGGPNGCSDDQRKPCRARVRSVAAAGHRVKCLSYADEHCTVYVDAFAFGGQTDRFVKPSETVVTASTYPHGEVWFIEPTCDVMGLPRRSATYQTAWFRSAVFHRATGWFVLGCR